MWSSLVNYTARYFGNNWTAERTQYSITCPSSIPAARNTRFNAMTQIIPATRTDDSKFSWRGPQSLFSRPIHIRACASTFLRPMSIRAVAILPAVPVDLPNVKWIPVQLAATRFSKVLRASCAARCFVRREYERHHSQTRTMVLTCIEPECLLLTLPADTSSRRSCATRAERQ